MVPLAFGLDARRDALGTSSSSGSAPPAWWPPGSSASARLLATTLLWTSDMPYWPIGLWFFGVALSMGCIMGPATDSVMGAVPKEKAGVASAMNDVTRQVGGALGTAVIGSLVASFYSSRVADAASGLPSGTQDAVKDSIGGADAVAAQLPGRPGRLAGAQPPRARSPTRWASGSARPRSPPSWPPWSSSAACPPGPPRRPEQRHRGARRAGRGCGMTADYDAVLFDLDGVLTSTADAACALLEAGLRRGAGRGRARHSSRSSRRRGRLPRPRRRQAARGRRARLPGRARHRRRRTIGRRSRIGSSRKQALVEHALGRGRGRGVPGLGGAGSASSARAGVQHRRRVLERERSRTSCAPRGIDDLFDERRSTAATSRELGLRGKPAPDGFLEARRAASACRPTAPSWSRTRSPGVAAGRAGGLRPGDRRGPQRRARGPARRRRRPRRAATSRRSCHEHDARRAPARALEQRRAARPPIAYPIATWQIVERRLPARAHAARSSRSSRSANGYLGLRGAPEEGAPAHDAGAMLNGFHETWPIVYPEDAYGLARTGQTIVNADRRHAHPALRRRRAASTCQRADRCASSASLDMQTGVLSREVEWETARGQRMLVRSRRLASLAAPPPRRHATTRSSRSTRAVRIAISSELVTHGREQTADDPRRGKGFAEKVLRAGRGARERRPRAVAASSPRATAAWSWRAGWSIAIETAARRDGPRRAREGDGAAGRRARRPRPRARRCG